MGFFRIERGNNTLGVESRCVWATPGTRTAARVAPPSHSPLTHRRRLSAGTWTEFNTPCYEDGGNCIVTARYPEPGAAPAGKRVAHGEVALKRAAALLKLRAQEL